MASALNEIALQSGVGITLDETSIPVKPAVQAACEMLGFDPLYVANEGKLLAFVSEDDVNLVQTTLQKLKYGGDAVVIGHVTETNPGLVLMKTGIGSTRVVDVMAGEMLPRIC